MADPHDAPSPPAIIDRDAVGSFWRRCVATGAVADATTVPDDVFWFGDSAAMADELAELVVAGTKRATAGAVAAYEREDEPLPQVGQMGIVVDGAGGPRALIRTTEVRVGPLSSVDDRFAWDEGEGDRTRASWLREHEAFFRRDLASLGLTFADDMPTVFERFEVLYAE